MTGAPRGELQTSTEPFRAMVQHLSDVLMVVDQSDATIRYVSPSVEQVFGYRPDDLIGTDGFLLVHPDDRERERRRLAHVVETGDLDGAPQADLFRFAAADGGWRTVETVANVLADRDQFLVAIRDISSRLSVERELATSVDRFRTLANLAPVAIVEMDPNGAIVFANERLAELTGFAAEPEVLTERWPTLIHPLDRPGVLAAWAEIQASPRRHEVELTIERPDGTERHLTCRVDPVHDADGELAGWIGTAEDVTAYFEAVAAAEAQAAELEEANRELRASQASAAQANRAKSEFLSRMSHELRTPLNSIIGFAQLLELGDLGQADHDEAVSIILQSGRHLLNLVEEVLDISRIETGGMSLSLEPVDVTHLVEDTVRALRPEGAEHEVTLIVDDDDEPVYARADRQRLLQVLINLVSNGIKFNDAGGWVAVQRRADPDAVRLTVSDSGRGIAAEHLDRLFEPFDRLDAETIGVGGTGLGLALSKALIEEMGGRLEVSSTVGRGTVFTVELPPALTEEHSPGLPLIELTDPPADQAAASSVRTVLYIEDNPVNYKLVERALKARPEVRLVGAGCGIEGLAAAGSEHPDLILLDLHLPDVSGFEVLARLRADPATADIPVTVLTADAMPGRREQVTGDGRTGYLTKPLHLPDLLEVVDTATPGH